jgi:hypothetical protein
MKVATNMFERSMDAGHYFGVTLHKLPDSDGKREQEEAIQRQRQDGLFKK